MAEINEAVLQSYYPQSQGQSTAGQTIPSALAAAISLSKLTDILKPKATQNSYFKGDKLKVSQFAIPIPTEVLLFTEFSRHIWTI